MNKAYDVNKALELLKSKGVGNLKCPFCGSKNFSLQSEIAKITVNADMQRFDLGRHIPAAIMICTNCGNIQFFSLGILGMMNTDKEDGQ